MPIGMSKNAWFTTKNGILKKNLKLYLNSWDYFSYPNSGTVWYDLTENSYDATWNETMEYHYINSVDAEKDGKRAFYLKSDYAFVTGLNYGNGNTISEMSVFAWIKSYYNSGTTGTWANNNWAILDFDRSEVFTFAINTSGEVQMSGYSSNNGGIGGTNYDIVGNARVNDFRWHYVGWTFSVADQKIVMYVDGEVDRTFNANGNMTALGAGLARWGVIGDGSERNSEGSTSRNSLYYDGYISEIHFYDERALTEKEVKINYENTKNYYNSEEGMILLLDANDPNSYSGSGLVWNDISGKENDCVLADNVSFYSATGGDPAYLHFDGSTSSYAEGPLLPLVDSFSLDCWFRGSTTQPNSFCRLITRSNLNFGNYTLAGDTNNDYLRTGYVPYEASSGNTETYNSSVTGDLKTYKWVDYTGVVDFNQKDSKSYLYLYKNGTLISSTTNNGNGQNPTNANEEQGKLFLGNANSGTTPYEYGFSGDICSVKIHNKALSSTEVFNQFAEKALEVSGIVTDGLVLNLDAYFYHTSQGTTWCDISGNGLNGTLTNGPTYDSANKGSIVFDGVNDHISINYNASLNPTGGLTVSLWAYKSDWDVTTGHRNLISCTEGGGWQFSQNHPSFYPNDVGFLVYIAGQYRHVSTPLSSIPNGWNLITGTFDGQYLKIYINEILKETYDHGSSTTITYGSNIKTIIGAEPTSSSVSGQYWSGNISTVQIYNRALSSTEITQNFNALRGRYGI